MNGRAGVRALGAAVLALALAGSAGATTIDESSFGDISGDIDDPDLFSLELGSNLLIANSGGSGSGGATNGSDAEFLTVTVPVGLILSSIAVNSRSGPSFGSFIAYGEGATLPGLGVGDIAGSALFNEDVDDLLGGPSLGPTDDTLGVDSLPSGTYAFWIQETAGAVDYSLDFVVTPEPGTGLLLAVGLAGLALRRAASP